MPRRWSRLALLLITCALLGAATSIPPTVVRAQDDAARFADLIAARTATGALTAPAADTFVQEESGTAVASLHLSLTDFSVSAIFTNPTETTEPWDYGFSFRDTGETGQDVFVDSDGTWYYGILPQGIQQSGTVPGFDASPGAMNRLDLIVEGTTALFGVNGEFVTSLALPPPSAAADVRASTGFFDDTVVAGREIRFENFIVWPLPGPEPPAPDLSPADIAAFAEVVSGQPASAPLAGPLSGTLEEAEDVFGSLSAGVVPLPFHAQATFLVPRESLIPWDIGFAFGLTPDGSLRVIADANGLCWFAAGPEAVSMQVCAANGLRTTAGEANTLELIATAERAFLVINGRLTAAFDLPPDVEATDPKAAVGLLAGQVVPGRVTEVSDFTVWPLASQPEGTATPAATPVATPTSLDREQFLELIAGVEADTPVAGPFSGRLVEQTPGSAPTAPAGVALADFAVFATFTNPEPVADIFWDAGFSFRGTVETNNLLILDSAGDLYIALAGEDGALIGHADAYDATAAAVNTLQLFIQGDRALAGVNGQFVAAFTIPGAATTSDVLVGAAWFDQDFAAGRVTAYQDFRVWELVGTEGRRNDASGG